MINSTTAVRSEDVRITKKWWIGVLIRSAWVMLMSFLLVACGTMDTYRDATTNPDDRLNDLLILLEYERSRGNQCLEIRRPPSAINDCQRILVEMERLYSDFPYHERTMMALAVMYYQYQRNDRAQFVLDQLLAAPGARPEAALLRARIAMEEGNVHRAEQLLSQQLVLAPGNADLRSALASIYYLRGDIQRATNVLNVGVVGHAEPWALTYHNGLLAEAERQWLVACQLYLQSLAMRPDYSPARARVLALAEHITCNESALVAAVAVTPFEPAMAVSRQQPVPVMPEAVTPAQESRVVAAPVPSMPPVPVPAMPVPAMPVPVPKTLAPAAPVSAARSSLAVTTQPALLPGTMPDTMPSTMPSTMPARAVAGMAIERISTRRVKVALDIHGDIDDALMIQLQNPDRVIVQLPATSNLLGRVSEAFSDDLLETMTIYEADGAINLRINMVNNATVYMINEAGRIDLYFDAAEGGQTLL